MHRIAPDGLIDRHPEVGKGLDIARHSGTAIRDGDDWITADE